jgi:hypothetical protein
MLVQIVQRLPLPFNIRWLSGGFEWAAGERERYAVLRLGWKLRLL